MSIQDSTIYADGSPDLFNIDQFTIIDQNSSFQKYPHPSIQPSFFSHQYFSNLQLSSALYPQFFPSYLQNIFKAVSGTFSYSSNWQQLTAKLFDPSIQNLDRFNTLLQNFSPDSSSNIYRPQYSSTQLFINSLHTNHGTPKVFHALVQTISLLPPQTFSGFPFYSGNPVNDFGFSFFPFSSYNSKFSIFDADRYVDQLQFIYNSPDIKNIHFFNPITYKFSLTPILQKKNNILYIQFYNSVLPVYIDSSLSPNSTILFLQTSDPHFLYDYSQWQTTIFKSSRLTPLQIYNHFYPPIHFIFQGDLHFFNHFDARWLLKLFNIHYLYNHFYFSLQGFLSFQNFSIDLFPSISFQSSKSIIDPTYQKSYSFIHYPNYSLFHLQYFSDLQSLALHSPTHSPQLLFRFFHDSVPSQSPSPIPILQNLFSDDDDDLIFGTISFNSSQSNYNYSPNEDQYLLSDPRIQQIDALNPTKFKYIREFQTTLDYSLSIDQFIFIFNYKQDISSFNKKIQNSSPQYAHRLLKNMQFHSSQLPQIKKLILLTCTYLQVAISSFYIYLISNKFSFSNLSPQTAILLDNFSNKIIDAAYNDTDIRFIQNIGSTQLSHLIFSELQSFGDSYSYFSKTTPISPSSLLSQFQYFKPPLFSQFILPDQLSYVSTFNHINRLLIPASIPFYSDIDSILQTPSQTFSHPSSQLLLHSFSNFKNSRIQKYSFPYLNPFSSFKTSLLSPSKPPSKSFPSPFNYDSILNSSSPDRHLHLLYTIQKISSLLSPHQPTSSNIFSDLQTLSSKESHRVLINFIRFKFSSIVQKFSLFYPSPPPPSSYINQIIENNIHIFSSDFLQYNSTFLSSYSPIQNFDYSNFDYLELVYILLKSFILYIHLIDFSTDDKPDISSFINIHNQYDQYFDQEHNNLIIDQALFQKSTIVLDCLVWYLQQQFSHNIIDYPSLIQTSEQQREDNKNYKLNISKNLNPFQEQLRQQGFFTLDDFVKEIYFGSSALSSELDSNFDKDTQPLLQDDPDEFDDYYQASDQESDDDNLDRYNDNYDD